MWIIGLFAYSLIGLFNQASAQTTPGLDLTISPGLLDITALPGTTVHEKFRIRNNNATPVELTFSLDKLTTSSNGQIIPAKVTSGDESLSWVHMDNNNIVTSPKEWTDVTFSIDIPQTAAFGYYYALHIRQKPVSQGQDKPSTKLLGEIILPILLTVQNSNEKAQLSLVSFKPTLLVNEYLPVTFTITLANTGNIHIRPQGDIFIKTSISDKNATLLDINQANGAILPNSKRTYQVSWNDGFLVRTPVMENGVIKTDNKGNPVTTLTINWNQLTHFRIGKYTASLLLVYDNGKRDIPIEATTTFWVFPYTLVASSIVGLLIVILIVRFLLKWYIHKELKKYRQ